MADLEAIVEAGVAKRSEAIKEMDSRFRELQEEKLRSILSHAAGTEFGRAHGFGAIGSVADFRSAVPPTTAADYEEAWKRVAKGERNIVFPDPVHAYALSSGTTGEPKTVPLCKALVRSLRRAIGYTAASYMASTGNFSLLRGYALQMTAPTKVRMIGDAPVGYITGIMGASRTYPFHQIGIPPDDVLDLMDWSEKYAEVERRYLDTDVRMIYGIPGYILGLLQRLTETRGVDDLTRIWPKLELIVTSGVALRSHRDQFERLCPGVRLREMYLATEAAVAFQPSGDTTGMLPMVGDLFLEFVPEDRWGEADAPRHTLGNVETGVRYVILLTTPSGLYAYSPGDIVRFEQLDPPRLVVEGRYGNVLNLASEKLDEEQAERVLRKAGLGFVHFSVCPAVDTSKPRHEWVVEFSGEPPPDAAQRIDRALRDANPLYRHMREGDLLFARPLVTAVRPGTYDAALRRRPGQGKILRVYRDRTVRDELIAWHGA